MLLVLALELTALLFTGAYAVKLREPRLIAAVALLLYSAVAVGLGRVPPHASLPGHSLLEAHWSVFPILSIALAAFGTWAAFRRSASEWEGTSTHRHAERAGFAFLALTLLHVAFGVIVAIGQALIARDA